MARVPPRGLKQRAREHSMQRLAKAIAPTTAQPTDEHAPTSGYSTTQIAPGRWMPHDYKPIVGFTPNQGAH